MIMQRLILILGAKISRSFDGAIFHGIFNRDLKPFCEFCRDSRFFFYFSQGGLRFCFAEFNMTFGQSAMPIVFYNQNIVDAFL